MKWFVLGLVYLQTAWFSSSGTVFVDFLVHWPGLTMKTDQDLDEKTNWKREAILLFER